MESRERTGAVRHQRLAEEALQAASLTLAALIGQVAEITTLESMAFYESETHVLTRIMMIAVEQRHVRQRTRHARPEHLAKFTRPEQLHLMRATRVLATHEDLAMFPQLDRLPDAANQMEAAAADLRDAARSAAVEHQDQAERFLRADIAALVADMLQVQDLAPALEAQGGGGESLTLMTSMPMEAVRIFGKAPAHIFEETGGGRSTWEPLNPRQRAALSEHFARELPLEYRSHLKAYYRALAE
jgi:hypothetical protein